MARKIQKTLLIEPHLEDCLLQQAVEGQENTKKKGMGLFTALLLTALVVALVWMGWGKYQINKQSNSLVSALEQEPGIFLTDSEVKRGVIHMRGLRDNSATQTAEILQNLNIDSENVNLNFSPFYSLEKEIVQKRIVSKLNIPDDVSFELAADGKLSFAGEINSEFKLEAQNKLQNMLGISSIQFTKLVYSDQDLLAKAKKMLAPPNTVRLKVDSGVLVATGTAPFNWHNKLNAETTAQIEGLVQVNDSELEISELNVLSKIESELNNYSIQFVWRTSLQEGEEERLPALANELKIYGTELEKLGVEPEIVLTGFTDRSGSLEKNRDLQNERALYIKGRLVGLGLRSNWIFVRTGSLEGEQNQVDPSLRRVEISLNSDLERFTK